MKTFDADHKSAAQKPSEAVFFEQVLTLYKQSTPTFAGTLLAASVALWVVTPAGGRPTMLVWWLAVLVLTLFRYILVRRCLASWGLATVSPMLDKTAAAASKFALGAFTSGCLWGTMGLLSLSSGDSTQVLFASFVLGGMVSGAMGSLSVFTPAYLAFAFPAVLPFAVGCFLSGNAVLTGFGLLTSVFALVSLGYGVGLNRTLRHSIELRFANAQLLLDLQAERDLARRGDADKTALLAAATHDLRQPAYAAGLYACSLRQMLAGSSAQVRHVSERLSASIDAFNGLLEGLLDLAQLDAGAQLPPPQPIAIKQLLESVAAALAATAAQNGVSIRVRVSMPLAYPVVLAPYDALHRVLLNLTSNAIKFTDGKHVLLFARCVSISAGGSRLVRIGVADAGPGIASTDQQQLFKAFERLPHTHSKPGLGLGLAIVKRLSEQMHASIALHSAIGRGSRFSLEVPINNEATPMRQLPVTVQTSAIQVLVVPNNKTGLAWVVDDDLQALAATEHALTQLGLQTRGFTDAQSVLDALTACLPENRPCIVVTDLHLGAHSPIDGLALAQRARSAVPAIAALVITGETAPSHLQRIAASGVPVLRKPCKSDALRDMVLGLL